MSNYFCPSCGNLLLMDTTNSSLQLKCRSCSYMMGFQGTRSRKIPTTKMEVVPIDAGNENTDFQNKAEARCEKCGHNEAYFIEIQIRSADEPSTIFYTCCKCGYKWRDG